MFWIIILINIIVLFVGNGQTQSEIDHDQLEVIQIFNTSDLWQRYPDVKYTKLHRISPPPILQMRDLKKPIRYVLGAPKPGDILLVEGSNVYYYPTLQDVQLQLSYPQSGVGGVVNHVEILVNQDSESGFAYIVAGGLGERFIRIIVEAKLVTHFSYKALFYGKRV